jgi:chromosome segregation ATPase
MNAGSNVSAALATLLPALNFSKQKGVSIAASAASLLEDHRRLSDELAKVGNEIEDLENKLPDLVFADPEAFAKAERRIDELTRRKRPLEAALTKLDELHDEALKREAIAEEEQLAAQAREVFKTIVEKYPEAIGQFVQLGNLAGEIKTLGDELQRINAQLKQRGRDDLILREPIAAIARKENREVSSPFLTMHLPGFWPDRNPDAEERCRRFVASLRNLI